MPPFDMVTMARGIWAKSAVVSVNGLAIAPVTEIEDVACCDHAGNATASMTLISIACRTAQTRFIKPHFKLLRLTCMVLYTTLSLIKDEKYLGNSVMNTKQVKEGWMRIARTIVVIAIMFHALVASNAQSTKVELSGAVRDPAGLAVPEAQIRLQNMNTDAEQSTSSGADGQYHFVAIPPGTYSITAMKPGFAATRREGLTLGVGAQITVD